MKLIPQKTIDGFCASLYRDDKYYGYSTCFLIDYSNSDRIVFEGAAYLKDGDSVVVVDSLPSSPDQ